MKKTQLIATSIALSATLLTGCGNDVSKAEEVATNFAYLMTDAKIEEAKEISNNLSHDFEKIQHACAYSEVKRLKKATRRFASKMKMALKKNQDNKDYKEKIIAITKETEAKIAVFKKGKHITPNSIPKNYQSKMNSQQQEKMFEIIRNGITQIFEVANMDYDKNGLEVMVQMKLNHELNNKSNHPLDEAVNQILAKNPAKITKECIDASSKFGNIKDIKHIMTEVLSPDKVKVRLELVANESIYQKATIQVEKIQNQWKVSHI